MKFLKLSSILLFFFICSTSIVKSEAKTITKSEFIENYKKFAEKRFNEIDANKDGKITPKEQDDFRKKVVAAQKKARAKIAAERDEIKKKLDTNKDGKISKEELEKADANKDGKISLSEARNLSKK